MAAHWDRLGKASTGVSTAVSFSLSISIFFVLELEGFRRIQRTVARGISFWFLE